MQQVKRTVRNKKLLNKLLDIFFSIDRSNLKLTYDEVIEKLEVLNVNCTKRDLDEYFSPTLEEDIKDKEIYLREYYGNKR